MEAWPRCNQLCVQLVEKLFSEISYQWFPFKPEGHAHIKDTGLFKVQFYYLDDGITFVSNTKLELLQTPERTKL